MSQRACNDSNRFANQSTDLYKLNELTSTGILMTRTLSRYAKRLSSDSGTVQLMEDLGRADRFPGDAYRLGGGNPALIPEVIAILKDSMREIVDDADRFSRFVGQYDSPRGNAMFIEVLCEMLRNTFGWAVGPEHVVLTNGSQASFGVLFNLFAGPYDDGLDRHIALPVVPEYVGYSDVGINERPLFRATVPRIELMGAHRFKYRLDLDQLVLTEDIAAICCSRPTNPSGNVLTDQEVATLAGLSREAGIPLIIDGAYGLPFPGIIFNEATPYWDDNTILCLSLSKLGLPGVRTGIVIAPPDIAELVRNANAINTLAPSRVGPELVTDLLRGNAITTLCKDVIRPYYAHRMHAVVEMIEHHMADLPVRIHEPEGAIFVWLWFEGLPIHSDALYRQLTDDGVFVIAGHHFFPGLQDAWQHSRECIRLNYANDLQMIENGIKIIARHVRAAYAEC